MPGIARFFLLVAAILSILMATLAILIQTQLTPELVRSALLPMVEKQLGRTVTIGDVHIGIFSGVSISDLNIHETESSDLFLTVGSALLRYRLWSLLQGRLDISEILLDGPAITLIRHPDGHFNFIDLLVEEKSVTPPERGTAETGASLETPFDLLIAHISVRNGQILFIDRFINPAAPFRYNFSNLNLTARDLSLDRSFPLDLAMVLNQSQVNLSAQIDLARQTGNAALHVSPLDLIPFAPYFRNVLPGTLGSAELEINLDLDWTPERLLSRGKIALNQVDMVLRDFPDMPLREGRLATDYSLRYDMQLQLLDISTALLNINDIKASMQGSINLAVVDPAVDLQIVLDKVDLRHSIQNLPQSLTRQLQFYSPAGELTMQLRLLGVLSSGARLIHSARIRLNEVQATVGHLRTGINGDINYVQNQLTSDNLLLKGGDQQVRLTFNLTDLLTPPLSGTFTLSSRELDLGRFFPEEKGPLPAPSQAVAASVPAHELGPFELPVDIKGTATIDRVLYRQVSMQQVNAVIALKDNRLTLAPLNGRIGEGQFSLATAVDLRVAGLRYEGQAVVTQPNLSTLMTGFFPAITQKVSGQVNWINSFSGRGTSADKLLNALQLDGEIQLSQGALSSFAVLDKVSWFLDSPDLKNLTFSDFQGIYHLKDGKVLIDGHLDGAQVKMAPKGSIGVDGSINLTLATRLAPEILSRMGASERLKQSFVDSSGWGVLPLELNGSLTSPLVRFDTRALEQQAIDQAKREAADRLLERMPPEVQGESRESMKNLLDSTLRRLRYQ